MPLTVLACIILGALVSIAVVRAIHHAWRSRRMPFEPPMRLDAFASPFLVGLPRLPTPPATSASSALLPIDLLGVVCRHLAPDQLSPFRLVCKETRRLVDDASLQPSSLSGVLLQGLRRLEPRLVVFEDAKLYTSDVYLDDRRQHIADEEGEDQPDASCIMTHFLSAAALYPKATIAVYLPPTTRLSFGALHRRALALRAILHALGFHPCGVALRVMSAPQSELLPTIKITV